MNEILAYGEAAYRNIMDGKCIVAMNVSITMQYSVN